MEVEVRQETSAGERHVAWVDLDSNILGVQQYRDITKRGGANETFEWDGRAGEHVNWPLAELDGDGNVFYGKNGHFNRAMPAITANTAVPPPFYNMYVRILSSDKTKVLHEHKKKIFIPQPVQILLMPGTITKLCEPITFSITNGTTITTETLYAGTDLPTATAVLNGISSYVNKYIPDGVNLRILDNFVADQNDHISFSIHPDKNPNGILADSENENPKNAKTTGFGNLYLGSVKDALQFYALKRVVDNDLFTMPISVDDYALFVALLIIHEIAHLVGLVDDDYLESDGFWHNFDNTWNYIMNPTPGKKLEWIIGPGFNKTWKLENLYYLQFILPTK